MNGWPLSYVYVCERARACVYVCVWGEKGRFSEDNSLGDVL